MFISSGQFYVFIACVALGGIFGILFSISELSKYFIKNTYIKFLPDAVAFCLVALGFITISFILKFPNFRIYMAFGVLLGVALYFKSFHIILAKTSKKLYNIIVKKLKRKRLTKDERRKG